MGFEFEEDGECCVCGSHSNKFCDHCHKYICDKHIIEVPDDADHHIMCKECYEKGKSKINRTPKGLHHEYHF